MSTSPNCHSGSPRAADLVHPAVRVRPTLCRLAQPDLKPAFMALCEAYRPCGGLAPAQELAARFLPCGWPAISTLAGWIIHRRVVSLEWDGRIWLPRFQFQAQGMARLAGLAEVLAELVSTQNDWQVAHWFVDPNSWLLHDTPARALAGAAPHVVLAARAQRQVLAG